MTVGKHSHRLSNPSISVPPIRESRRLYGRYAFMNSPMTNAAPPPVDKSLYFRPIAASALWQSSLPTKRIRGRIYLILSV